MPESNRRWSDNDISNLRSLAGKVPVSKIAVKLGRSEGAVMAEASKLKLSLRYNRTRAQQPQHVPAPT
jgi:hypothetical protein